MSRELNDSTSTSVIYFAMMLGCQTNTFMEYETSEKAKKTAERESHEKGYE